MTGNVTLFSQNFSVKKFKTIIQKNKGYFFDEENVSGGIDSGNGNIYFYFSKKSIIDDQSIHFEINSTLNDSDKIMCRLIYSMYEEFVEVEIKANFVLVFDSENFIKEHDKIKKLDTDYDKKISLFCESKTVRDEIKKTILESQIDINIESENNKPPLKTSYFLIKKNKKQLECFTLDLNTMIIDSKVIHIFLEICEKYNILIGFLDDYQLSSIELAKFETQIVKFY